MLHDLAFWREDIDGGGGDVEVPADEFYIAWNADQITGDTGKFTSELPPGSPASATGDWVDSDATPAEPVQEIYFTVDREGFELGVALTGAAETTVQVGRPPGPNVPPRGTLRITDDSGAYRELEYASFTGSTFTLVSSADFTTTGAAIGNAVGVVGRRIEVTGNTSFDAPAGTWDLTHSEFVLAEDAQTMISYITDFNSTQASASVLFLFDQQDPLQSLDIPAPTKHPNFRSPATGLDWEFVTAYSTPKPDWEWDDEDTQYQLTTTGYGGHVKIPASLLAPTSRLVVSADSEYAGKACEPRFSVACPEGKSITIETIHVRGGTVTTDSHTFDGPIDWTGNPNEINITLPKIELDVADRLDIRIWATGAGSVDPLWQRSDHRVVERGVDPPFEDPNGIFVDPVNGDDEEAQFGNVNRPYRSYVAWSRDTVQNNFPTGTAENPINVYQPRGTVAEWSDGGSTPSGDACYLKNNTFHMKPWPGTSGQAPVISGRYIHPKITENANTEIEENRYGGGQVGCITLRNCSDSIVEDFIVDESRHCGIVVEVNQNTGGVCDNNIIRNCLVKRSGSDGVLVRGMQTAAERANNYQWPANVATNITVKNVHVRKSADAMQSEDNISPDGSAPTTGQAITTSFLVGGLIEDCSAIDFRKEGFDAIASRNVTFRRCYAKRAADTPYGSQRGANYYTDSSQEGCRDILFEQCTSAGGSAAFRITSEGGGEMIRVKFLTCWAWGGTSAPLGFTDESSTGVVVEDCGFEHCTVLDENNQFAVVDTLGSPSLSAGDIFVRNCILVSNRRDIMSSQNNYANWDVDGNVFFSTSGTITDSVSELGTNYVVDVDPQFVSATDLRPQNAAMLGQITPPIRTVNILNQEVPDPDNYGAY